MASSVRVGPPSLVYQQVRSSALRFVCSKLQHVRADGTLCVLMVDEELCAAVDTPPGVELHSRMVGVGDPTGRLYDAVVVSLVGLGGPSRSAALREAMLAAGDASPCVIVTCSEGRGAWVLRERYRPSPGTTGGSDSPAPEPSIAQMIEATAGAASPPRAILREPFHAVLDLGDGLDAAGAADGRGRPSSREPAALAQRATLSSVVSALLGADAAAAAARWPAELGASLAELRARTLHNVAAPAAASAAGGAAAARTVLHLPLTASVLGPWDRHWLLRERLLDAPPPTPPPQTWHPASAALPPLFAGGMQFLASMADHLGLAAKLSATFGPPGGGGGGSGDAGGAALLGMMPGGRLGSPSTDSEAAGVELPLRTHDAAAAAAAGDAAPPPAPPLPCAPWPVPLALHLSVQGGAERFADGSVVLAMVRGEGGRGGGAAGQLRGSAHRACLSLSGGGAVA